jgi:hypothetical protein
MLEPAMRRDIDDALHGWPYEPNADGLIAREIRARDGRTVIQVRIELGVLQLEVEGRPDGVRPHGFETYLDYLRYRAAGRGLAPGGKAPRWVMDEDHRAEADREFALFYHRRLAWLSIQRYEKALLDADHTLELMDFVARHASNADYVASHEKSRGLVLFHRTQAAAAMALERRRPEEAIDAVREGAERLHSHQRKWENENPDDEISNGRFVEELSVLEEEIRREFSVAKTLREQLDEAVAREDYERAATLRDQIRARGRR